MTIGTIAWRDDQPLSVTLQDPADLAAALTLSTSGSDDNAATGPVINVVSVRVSAAELAGVKLGLFEVTTTDMAPADEGKSTPLTLMLAGPPNPKLLPAGASVPSLSVELV